LRWDFKKRVLPKAESSIISRVVKLPDDIPSSTLKRPPKLAVEEEENYVPG